jgi:RNA polymerase sigma factor (sigma-70 family)
MANASLGSVLRQLRQLVGGNDAETTADAVLLERFAAARDEQAFEELMARHGSMVFGVCRRVLDNEHDAADAYQATFLVLARKAGSIRKQGSVGSWLYGVAYRVSRKARASAARQRTTEQPVNPMCDADPSSPAEWNDLRQVLDDELNRLPAKYRDPLVLCYLEGQTHESAAKSLGWPTGTMSRRVGRGLEWLRERLTRRGVTLPSAALAAALTGAAAEAAPAALSRATAQAAVLFAGGTAVGGAVSAQALTLAEGILHALHLARLKAIAAIALAVGLVTVSAGAIYQAHARSTPPPGSSGARDDFAAIERRIQDLQPTPAERRIDAIGWAADVPEAIRLAGIHNRPVFLFTHEGRIGTGRCGGSAFNLRANTLADERVIALINASFVPVFSTNEDRRGTRPVSKEERDEVDRIYRSAHGAGLPAGEDYIYLLDPTGKVIDGVKIKTAKNANEFIEKLKQTVARLGTASGQPVVAPHALSVPPPAPPGGLVLHLVSRINHRKSWSEFPAENWIVLPAERAELLLGPRTARVGDSWTIDPKLSADLLTYFYPQTENNDLATNELDRQSLRATLVSEADGVARARLEGELRMKHRFYTHHADERFVDAALIGTLEYDPTTRRVLRLRLLTDSATYGEHTFAAGMAGGK